MSAATAAELAGLPSAAADAVRARETLQAWEHRRVEARAAVATADREVAALVLDDPEAGTVAAERRREVRDRVETADQAVKAQQRRVDAAEVACIRACAVALRDRRDAQVVELEAHRAKTARLLGELAEHECEFIPLRDLRQLEHRLGLLDLGTSWSAPRSDDIVRELEVVRRQLDLVESALRGEDVEAKRSAAVTFGRDVAWPADLAAVVTLEQAQAAVRRLAAS